MIDKIIEIFGASEFLQGGALLMIGGSILAYLRHLPKLLWKALMRFYTVELYIRDVQLVNWFSEWLSHREYAKNCRRLMGALGTARNSSGSMLRPPDDDEENPIQIILSPGMGVHVFRVNRKWFWISRSIQDGGDKEMSFFIKPEEVNIRTWGRDKEKITNMMDSLKSYIERTRTQKSAVNVLMGWGDWQRVRFIEGRSLDSIILPGDSMKRLVDDIEWFFERRQWYIDHGIPHRRGYLFYGPPGNGKSSVVMALASHFKFPLYFASLKERDLTDQKFAIAMANLPPKSILLIEDADSAMPTRDKPSKKGVTLSGLLNAIDGPTAPDGRILFITTNFPEKIDAAVKRAGRLDLHIEFPNATPEQVSKLFSKFHPEQDEQAFAAGLEYPISMASVQEKLILNGTPEDEHAAKPMMP